MSTPVFFANYLQHSTLLPLRVWHYLRFASVAAAFGLVGLMFTNPTLALPLFWSVIVPILPAIFWLAPGLWRNICPMAALNQMPRLLGITKGLTHTPKIREYSYVLGIVLFFGLVSSRKWLFDGNGWATGALILFGLLGALAGGFIFKGKSGWCSSICPMLPVQRIYGQTPFLTVANAHCRPCVGCTKNCYDFNPGVAYLADQYDSDRHYVAYRRLFAGLLPGFILAFFTVGNGMDPGRLYLNFALYSGLSLALFHVLETFAKVPNNRLTILFGAGALNVYYLFIIPRWLQASSALTGDWYVPLPLVWFLQALMVGLSVWWIARSFDRENKFRAQSAQKSTSQAAKLGEGAVMALQRAQKAASTEVLIAPDNTRVASEPNHTLLDLIEGCGKKIESGCRMGVCGADPIAVTAGADCLSPIGEDEKNTLQRLGLAANTRLACSTRIRQGQATIELVPHKATVTANATPATFDAAIQKVVIIGNGIAGVTAADHIRRRHPNCTIQIVASENHPLYNRMGITRLVYGRSAMQGLHLMPESWYTERKIDVLLNTMARAIDTDKHTVQLADGDVLPYDRLILACGSQSFVPPIAGYGGSRCFVLRTADDAMHLRSFVQKNHARYAVVAGGGLLGLEAAYALHKLGIKVTVVERNHWLLHRQLDERAGHMLQLYLHSLGLEIVLGAQIKSLEKGSEDETLVHLDMASTLHADVFVVAAGITPNTDLAKAAGLEVNRAVLVDAQMQTSAKDVYAAGDVAEFESRTPGLWAVAVEQAEVAACNALGQARNYAEPVLSTVLKVVGADVVSVGQFEGTEGDTVFVQEDTNSHRYRKLIVRNGRLQGAILIGWPDWTEPVTKAVKAHADLSMQLEKLHNGDWPEQFSAHG